MFFQQHLIFPDGLDSEESACNQETWVWPLAQEDPLEEKMATQSHHLGKPIDWRAWQATVDVVTKSQAKAEWLKLKPLGKMSDP